MNRLPLETQGKDTHLFRQKVPKISYTKEGRTKTTYVIP